MLHLLQRKDILGSFRALANFAPAVVQEVALHDVVVP